MVMTTAQQVVFLGSANWQLAAEYLAERVSAAWGTGWGVLDVPFGQYHLQLSDPLSALRQSQPAVVVFAERIEDFLPAPYAQFSLADESRLRQRVKEYLASIRQARELLQGTFFVLDLALARPLVQGLAEQAYRQAPSLERLLLECNQQLAECCAALPDCHVLPLSNCLRQMGTEQAWSFKYWALGRFPYAPVFTDKLVECLLAAAQTLRGQSARVLVLDLDNTLWGGVIGDDGLGGIALGNDYPGAIYVAMQHVAKAWQERGVVLALCSKNTEAVALEAIERHPAMVLRKDDFLIRKINWQSKVDNLREISAEIGVGLASLCFIDDSPYERAAVRSALPQVLVPELPEDVAEWPDFVAQLPCLSYFALTQEDRERAARYQARQQVLAAQQEFSSREDYWRSLQMQLFFEPLADTNRQRVLQLIVKTNQFNTTTRRHREAEIAALCAAGAQVWALGLADRYAAREVIGVLIVCPRDQHSLEIESFILSCRVLGRSVEHGVLAWALAWARQQGYQRLYGVFTPTERNHPAASVYTEHGFTRVEAPLGEEEGQLFVCELASAALAMPTWFEVYDAAC